MLRGARPLIQEDEADREEQRPELLQEGERDQELQAGRIRAGKKGVIVAFEDETWTQLYPRIEAKWMKKGSQEKVLTPGYNNRKNVFVTIFWPKEIWVRLEQVREEEEQGVQAPPFQRPPAREEARRQECHHLHGTRPVSQDQEREEVHSRP
jgi:hypothetical protein